MKFHGYGHTHADTLRRAPLVPHGRAENPEHRRGGLSGTLQKQFAGPSSSTSQVLHMHTWAKLEFWRVKKKLWEIYISFPTYIKAIGTKLQMQNGMLTAESQFNLLSFITFHPNWPPPCFKISAAEAVQTSSPGKAAVTLFAEEPVSCSPPEQQRKYRGIFH